MPLLSVRALLPTGRYHRQQIHPPGMALLWVAASETHVNVDWPGTIKVLNAAVAAAAATTTAAGRLVVVDHWLLLWHPAICEQLSSLVYLNPFPRLMAVAAAPPAPAPTAPTAGGVADHEEDDQARALCRERRAGRSPRSDLETSHLRRYYDDNVWPAFLDNTHKSVCDLVMARPGNALRPIVSRPLGTTPLLLLLASWRGVAQTKPPP